MAEHNRLWTVKTRCQENVSNSFCYNYQSVHDGEGSVNGGVWSVEHVVDKRGAEEDVQMPQSHTTTTKLNSHSLFGRLVIFYIFSSANPTKMTTINECIILTNAVCNVSFSSLPHCSTSHQGVLKPVKTATDKGREVISNNASSKHSWLVGLYSVHNELYV